MSGLCPLGGILRATRGGRLLGCRISVARQAAAVIFGTLPLVGWFLATPWNSGPPFLVASLVAPCIAVTALARNSFVRTNCLYRAPDQS
jgi:hypothetical protein